jgi:hypothetical protein
MRMRPRAWITAIGICVRAGEVRRSAKEAGANMTSPHPLEAEMLAGSIRALRKRAEALRARASDGVVILDCKPAVLIVESKAAHLYRIARDFDAIVLVALCCARREVSR